MEFSITTENCRICLEDKPESKLLSDHYSAKELPTTAKLKLQCYMDVYKFVAEIHAEPASKLITPPSTSLFFPKRICNECVAQLKVAFVFRRKLLKSEKVLKNLLHLYGQQDLEETVEQEIEVKEEDTIDSNDEVQEYEYVDQEPEEYSAESEYEELADSSPVACDVQINLNQVDFNRQLKKDSITPEKSMSRGSNIDVNPENSRGNSPLFTDKPVTSQCEDCGKMISTRYLAKHRENHRVGGKKDKSFACDLCDRRYTLKENLNKHKRIHSNDKRYTCPYCDEKFMHWASRKYHIICRHTGEKPYVCEICGKGFRHSSQYYTHVRRHTGLAPYACELCDRKFITLQCKKMHMLTHTDAKNFHCDVCGKSYKSKKSLRVHIRTLHDQEKNYICPICNRAFSQNHVLRTHLLKTHPEYEPPPPGTIVSIRAIERMKEQSTITANISNNVSLC